MKLLYVLVACCWLLGPAGAHIHSQKVRHIERDKLTLNTWLCALVSSALVGACGVFPLLVNRYVKLDSSSKHSLAFKAVLSFAVGGLLGDVFLHLLPEAYGAGGEGDGMAIGLWVLVGFLSFLMVEKCMKMTECEEEEDEVSAPHSVEKALEGCGNGDSKLLDCSRVSSNGNSRCSVTSSNGVTTQRALANGKPNVGSRNGFIRKRDKSSKPNESVTEHNESVREHNKSIDDSNHSSSSDHTPSSTPSSGKWFDKATSGYLNLVANSTDNFTHGLAIAASYVASPAVGVLTTLAILCHEIPHEVGDFAILLNSGFSLRGAAKAQILTATGGLVGVVAGLTAEQLAHASDWLLPFTAGGFLYIALVSIVPDLLECTNFRHSVVEMLALGVGVAVMALVTIVEKKSCSHMPGNLPLPLT